ncbi:MAG: GNAT family N-acetyltransferase [Opitutales bacterium]
MASKLQIQRLDKTLHDRTNFDCGEPALNDYLAKTAALDMKRKAAGCWVITSEGDAQSVLGYYTLSSEAIGAVDLPKMPKTISKKLPKYRRFGAALLGRLAVAKSKQGQGFGELLLMDAFHRCLALEVPVVVIVVDPKDKKVADWYARFGFRALSVNRMVVTLLELEARFNGLDSHR